jgi:hypothetical protein
MLVAILTILVGALQTAGGAQELIVQGIFHNLRDPLVGGTLGTVAGALTLSAGIALLRESPRAVPLARASALLTLPVTVLIGFVWGLAGWPMRILGIAFPVFLLVYLRKFPVRSTVNLSRGTP